LHQYAFVENDVCVADRNIFLKGGITRDPDPGEAVDGTPTARGDPFEIAAETPGANRAGKKLALGAFSASLYKELSFCRPLPESLVDTVDLG
jgi:hypothetical protein